VWRTSTHSSGGDCAEVAAWRTSTASAGNGACAEVGAWRKSSASAYDGSCAEVGQGGTVVLIRDTKDRAGAWLAFDAETWAEFTERLKSA
jgi:hypothetical protein